MVNLGILRSDDGRSTGLVGLPEALPLLAGANRPIALADLKAMVGETLQEMGQVSEPSRPIERRSTISRTWG